MLIYLTFEGHWSEIDLGVLIIGVGLQLPVIWNPLPGKHRFVGQSQGRDTGALRPILSFLSKAN